MSSMFVQIDIEKSHKVCEIICNIFTIIFTQIELSCGSQILKLIFWLITPLGNIPNYYFSNVMNLSYETTCLIGPFSSDKMGGLY